MVRESSGNGNAGYQAKHHPMISIERLKDVIALHIFAHQHFVWGPNNFRTVNFGKLEAIGSDTTFRITQ